MVLAYTLRTGHCGDGSFIGFPESIGASMVNNNNRHMNGREQIPEIDTNIYGELIVDKDANKPCP